MVLDSCTVNMLFGYIKKILIYFGLDFGHDKKLHVKVLIPGVENGWNNNGSFKYKNLGGEDSP